MPGESKRLRTGLDNYNRVATEVDSAFNQIEDNLTSLEDREARRSQRNATPATIQEERHRQAGI